MMQPRLAMVLVAVALLVWHLLLRRRLFAAETFTTEEWDLPSTAVTVADVGPEVRYGDEDGDVNGTALPSTEPAKSNTRSDDIAQAASTGSSSGRLLASLPVAHLARAGGGSWGLKSLRLKKSTLVSSFPKNKGRPAIRVLYQTGSGTSKHNKAAGGMDLDAVPAGLPPTAAKLSFDVFFVNGFDFATGGKLGGFMIGVGDASGGKFSADGASHRVVFRPKGGVSSYVYLPTSVTQPDRNLKRQKFGLILNEFGPGTLRVGRWNNIVVGVVLNSVRGNKPVADGRAFLSVNGGRPKEYSGIIWRRRPDMTISRINMSTFFGGPDPSPRNNKALFANFQLRTY